jgi:hypothetical protein
VWYKPTFSVFRTKTEIIPKKTRLEYIPWSFLPLEKIGEELGCQYCKRLVKIGGKDWKKDWEKIDCLCSTHEEDKEETLSKDLIIHGDVSYTV